MTTVDVPCPTPCADGGERAARRRAALPACIDRAALRDVWPVAVSVAPFGMVIGVASGAAGLPLAAGLVGAFAVFAGSAHLAVLTLVAAGAGPLAVLGTVALVNARLLVYAAALAPRFATQPRWFRWFGPHLLVDQMYAIATARPETTDPTRFRRYWLTAGSALGTVWLTSVAVGSVAGPVLPSSLDLDFAVVAVFVGLLVPRLLSRTGAVVGVSAAVAAASGATLPPGVGLVLGVGAGIAVSVLLGAVRHRPAPGTDGTTGHATTAPGATPTERSTS